jgi:hypothetical protein
VHGHEVNRFRRRLLRGHDKVAFVLAIGVIGHDHNLARGDVAHDIVDRVEFKVYRGFRNHSNTITSEGHLSNVYSVLRRDMPFPMWEGPQCPDLFRGDGSGHKGPSHIW